MFIWFFFLLVSLFSLLWLPIFFSFLSSIIIQWSIVMVTALQFLSDNSHVSAISVSASVHSQFSFSLTSSWLRVTMSDFPLKSGHFRSLLYYEALDFTNLTLLQQGTGGPTSLRPGGDTSSASPLDVHWHPREKGDSSLLLGRSGGSSSSAGLHWYLPGWEG